MHRPISSLLSRKGIAQSQRNPFETTRTQHQTVIDPTCILWRSITDALSSLTGRGVLLTTTRKCHCSHLFERIITGAQYKPLTLGLSYKMMHNLNWNRTLPNGIARNNHKTLTQPVLHLRRGQKVVEFSYVQRSSRSTHPIFVMKTSKSCEKGTLFRFRSRFSG